MSTKSQLINQAYVELRISGLTVQPSPSDIVIALNRLEAMMSEFFYQWNLNIGYNFEPTPNVNSQSNVPVNFENTVITNLAVRLIASFNKECPQMLYNQASQALSNAIGLVSAANMQMVQPSRRMPIGNGNQFRGVFWNRFAVPTQLPPNVSSTNDILAGETQNYREDYSAYLGSATISSYTIISDPLLTIVTSANASPQITYTVTAINNSSYGPWQIVQITIVDSIGRTLIRQINFQVTTPQEIV